MKQEKSNPPKILQWITVPGGIFIILQILYAAADKNLHGILPEKIFSFQLIEFMMLNRFYL